MTTLRQAAEQALEALKMAQKAMGLIGADLVCEAAHHEKKDRHQIGEPCPIQARWHQAFAAIREALAQSRSDEEQPAQQEPVAWKDRTYGNLHHQDFGNSIPLYTSPPASKPWVGLSQQDVDIAFDDTQEGGGFNEFARAIEAELKEKNK